jgi:molybdopterin biosynthesis enzyme
MLHRVGAGVIVAGESAGRVLAAPVVSRVLPPRAVALQDGWAVKADELADASGYAPVPLTTKPVRVECGDEMPDGTDAVAPVDAVTISDGRAQAADTVTAGDGVLPAGADSSASRQLLKAGERIGAAAISALAAAEISHVSVRVPRLLIVTAREDLRLMPAAQLIARDATAGGADAELRNGIELDDALRTPDCDAVVVVGGSGNGRRDRSVRALMQHGTVVAHGVGLTPGETTAFGFVDRRPVLIVPGRLDAALASWLVLGRRLLSGLCGARRKDEPTSSLTLLRKVTSTVGLAEVVPVRRDNMHAEPLASKTLPLWALARANGWLLVPADSEGFPAGAQVAIYDWP